MEASERRPPPHAVAVTGDGALHKLVLQEGTGEMPPKHARCLVHYVGRLAETGEVFMDSRQDSPTQEPQEIVSGRESAYRELGLHLAVAGMRCGERCRLWAAPQYGYGAQGSFSFPTVPPNADLVYELELLEFEPPDEEKERSLMTFEERLEAAERRRQDGNALFKDGQTAEALGKYRLALSYMNEDLLMQLGDFHFQKAMDVKRPTLLNIAACQLRQEDYHAAIVTCGEVLTEEPGNAKALFRRGRARAALGQSEAAAGDFEKARAAAPEDGAIAKELAAVQQALKQERQAMGKMFQGYFDKSRDSLYEEQPPAVALAAAGGGGPQQALLHQQGRPGWALAAAALSIWRLFMRGLRALLPCVF